MPKRIHPLRLFSGRREPPFLVMISEREGYVVCGGKYIVRRLRGCDYRQLWRKPWRSKNRSRQMMKMKGFPTWPRNYFIDVKRGKSRRLINWSRNAKQKKSHPDESNGLRHLHRRKMPKAYPLRRNKKWKSNVYKSFLIEMSPGNMFLEFSNFWLGILFVGNWSKNLPSLWKCQF